MAAYTVYVDGTDNAATGHFLTLAAAVTYQANNYPDLTSDNGSGGAGPLLVVISITSAETSAVTVNGFTTSAANYVSIATTGSARHAGVWSESCHRVTTATVCPLNIIDDYVRIDGLQLRLTTGATEEPALYIGAVSATNAVWVSNCILRQAGNAANDEPILVTASANLNLSVWNCVCYGAGAKESAANCGIRITEANTVSIYNTVAIGGYGGIRNISGTTVVAKNCYASGPWNAYYGTITQTNCASSDTTADGTDPHDSVPHSTATFVNVTAGSEDYHLAGTGSGLYGHGADNTGDAAPLNFTTDIDGDTITGRFDIGADWYTTAATGQFARPASVYFSRRFRS